ncbi:MAG: hypothetical protein WDN28_15970 [Chthoniobacter sp.]
MEESRFGIGRTSLGPILAAFSEKGVVSISMAEDRDQLLRIWSSSFRKHTWYPPNETT